MSNLEPIYTPENVNAAYQLNCSLNIFSNSALPPQNQWLPTLKVATEKDAVRILEFREVSPTAYQFFLSTQPTVSPAQIIKSVKGRLQTIVRSELPKAFKRNYRLESIGEANNDRLQSYVARQPQHHPMSDPRAQQVMQCMQFFDPSVNLAEIRYSTTDSSSSTCTSSWKTRNACMTFETHPCGRPVR